LTAFFFIGWHDTTTQKKQGIFAGDSPTFSSTNIKTIKIHILLGYKWRYIRGEGIGQGIEGKEYTREGQGKGQEKGKDGAGDSLLCGAWVRKSPPMAEIPGGSGGA